MRSATGCWTCRLRRKKCDEEQPFCKTCSAREISCYGYGPRPEWMDRGENERRASERLSRAIKMATERRRDGNKMLGRAGGILEVSFVSNEFCGRQFESGASSNIENDTPIVQIDYQSLKSSSGTSQSSSITTEESQVFEAQCSSTSLVPSITTPTHETTLLMHYLDNVFPAHFRFYDPSQFLQGRGWLFSLLTKTKPAYHAALSLSAYYLSFSTSSDSGERSFWRQESVQHRVQALQYLQESIERLDRKVESSTVEDAVEVLTGVALLICFEESRGGLGNWQIHFQAASTLLPILTTYLETLESPPKNPSESAHLTTAVQVLVIVFLRFDALSCISTGKNPIFEDKYVRLLEGPNSKIQMQPLVGCKNWVFTLILDTAVLDGWKRKAQDDGKLSMRELTAKAAPIDSRLKRGTQLNMTLIEDLEQRATLSDEDNIWEEHSYISAQVTNVFAYATLLYLHVVVSGWYVELGAVQEIVARLILSFQSFPDKKMFGDLSWPFCIAGCVAMREDREIFRNLATQICSDVLGMSNFRKAFQIMERCWANRDELVALRKGSEWRDVMELLGPGVVLA